MTTLSRALRGLVLPLVALLVLVLVASTAQAAHGHRHRSKRSREIHHATRIALRQLGDPYVWGARGPRAFDCSGLVYYATHHAGLRRVPRTSYQQAAFMRHIKKRHLRRGDFLFFYDRGGVYHVGIFMRWVHGHARMLDAPHTGAHVRRERPWTHRWFAATLRHRHQHKGHHHRHHHKGHHHRHHHKGHHRHHHRHHRR